jgi:hypothetical protein
VTRDDTARLLDAAVPPIPVELSLPPYRQIRERARRRRQLAIAGCSVAVGVVLVAVSSGAGAVAPSVHCGRFKPTGTGPAAPSPTPPPSPAALNEPPAELPANPVPTWRVALIRRSGTDITIYVNPPARCWIYANPTVKVDEGRLCRDAHRVRRARARGVFPDPGRPGHRGAQPTHRRPGNSGRPSGAPILIERDNCRPSPSRGGR